MKWSKGFWHFWQLARAMLLREPRKLEMPAEYRSPTAIYQKPIPLCNVNHFARPEIAMLPDSLTRRKWQDIARDIEREESPLKIRALSREIE
jgi:hypothetical protein